MKIIGLIGGMSWESTIPYYRYINEEVRTRLGGLHSARVILYSVDFYDVEELQRRGHWDQAGEIIAKAAISLQKAGAEFIILCTNTMHKVTPQIEECITIPFLHIADATGGAVRDAGLKRVGLLGTRFTMEQNFYRERLEARHGVEVVIPNKNDRSAVHRVIYEELCQGLVREASKEIYIGVIENLVAQGVEGIIFGCTEIGLLIRAEDVDVQIFDSTLIHAKAAVAASFVDFFIPSNNKIQSLLRLPDFADTEQL